MRCVPRAVCRAPHQITPRDGGTHGRCCALDVPRTGPPEALQPTSRATPCPGPSSTALASSGRCQGGPASSHPHRRIVAAAPRMSWHGDTPPPAAPRHTRRPPPGSGVEPARTARSHSSLSGVEPAGSANHTAPSRRPELCRSPAPPPSRQGRDALPRWTSPRQARLPRDAPDGLSPRERAPRWGTRYICPCHTHEAARRFT